MATSLKCTCERFQSIFNCNQKLITFIRLILNALIFGMLQCSVHKQTEVFTLYFCSMNLQHTFHCKAQLLYQGFGGNFNREGLMVGHLQRPRNNQLRMQSNINPQATIGPQVLTNFIYSEKEENQALNITSYFFILKYGTFDFWTHVRITCMQIFKKIHNSIK